MIKTIRRVIAILLVATAVVLLVLPSADVSAVYYKGDYVIDAGTLVSYTGKDSDITIPIGITSIGKEAFAGNNNLTKVYIPDEVTSIDYAAFENCKNLQKVSIGDGVKSIGQSAFSGCQSLVDINLPKATDTIGSGAFAACPNLSQINIDPQNRDLICLDGVLYSKDGKKMYQYLAGRPYSIYDIPEPVTEIGEFGFYGANMLTTVNIVQGVEEIPEYSFLNCTALNKVTIPPSVKAIRKGAFGGCPNLTKLTVPTSVGFIDEEAFTSMDGVKGDVVDETTGNVLSSSGTAGTAAGTNVPTGNDGTYAMAEGDLPPSVDGANGMESVDPNAPINPEDGNLLAEAADAVGSVLNPSEPQKIVGELGSTRIVGGEAVFIMDPKSMKVKGFDIDAAQSEDSIADSGYSSAEGEDIRNYSGREYDIIGGNFGHYGGDNPQVILPEGITKIGNRVFYNNQNIDSVVVPQSVNEIGDFAFARSSVSSVSIPDSVSKIGYAAFYNCPNLTDIYIPSTVKDIELGALEGTGFMNNWRSIEDGNNFLIAGDNILVAYKGHSSEVKIPEGIETIGPGVFEGDSRLRTIYIPNSVTKISEDAFNGCRNLTSVELPQNLEIIEDRAFKDTDLSNVTIPKNCKEIGMGAFDTANVNGGMSAVIFKGLNMPEATYKPTATRLSANNLRTNAFNGTDYAFVSSNANVNSGSIFDPTKYGFKGEVYSGGITDDDGNGYVQLRKCLKEPDISGIVEVPDSIKIGYDYYYLNGVSQGAFDEYKDPSWCQNKLTDIKVKGNNSADLEKLLEEVNFSAQTGSNVGTGSDIDAIRVKTDGSINSLYVDAVIPSSAEKFNMYIGKDPSLKGVFEQAFDDRYGTHSGVLMDTLSIDMTDRLGTVPIKKMASNKLNMTLPVPDEFAEAEKVRVATIDDNGLLEELSTTQGERGDGTKTVSFVASHLSPFVIFITGEALVQNVEGETTLESEDGLSVIEESIEANESLSQRFTESAVFGTLQKEVVPGLPARYIVAFIMFATAGLLLLLNMKKGRRP